MTETYHISEEVSTVAMERLDKLLASTGRWSRKEVKELIGRGRVLVDGRPADGRR